jgi:hypothetical protein
MSEVELHIGTLQEIDTTPLNAEGWCKVKCVELGIKKDPYESYVEALTFKRPIICLNNRMYYISDKKLESCDVSEIYKNPNGTYNYVIEFYNGGTDLREMLEEAIKNPKIISK